MTYCASLNTWQASVAPHRSLQIKKKKSKETKDRGGQVHVCQWGVHHCSSPVDHVTPFINLETKGARLWATICAVPQDLCVTAHILVFPDAEIYMNRIRTPIVFIFNFWNQGLKDCRAQKLPLCHSKRLKFGSRELQLWVQIRKVLLWQ